MRKSRQSLGYILAILILLLVILLAYSMADANEIDTNEIYLPLVRKSFVSQSINPIGNCFPGEHCFIVWPSWDSEKYCDGGRYTLWFCYLETEPGNREYHHEHMTCDSSVTP